MDPMHQNTVGTGPDAECSDPKRLLLIQLLNEWWGGKDGGNRSLGVSLGLRFGRLRWLVGNREDLTYLVAISYLHKKGNLSSKLIKPCCCQEIFPRAVILTLILEIDRDLYQTLP